MAVALVVSREWYTLTATISLSIKRVIFVLKYSHNTVYFYEVHKNDFDDFDYFGTELIYWGQSGYESEISGNVVIIQRDNKPFIMPKKVTS